MSDKDQLLKQQREEIEKLKKELQDASKPSSMFSVFKNTMKRNVHDFFIREDKMKTMDSKQDVSRTVCRQSYKRRHTRE